MAEVRFGVHFRIQFGHRVRSGKCPRNGRDQLSTHCPLERVRLVRGDAASSLRFVLAVPGCTDVAKDAEEDAHPALPGS